MNLNKLSLLVAVSALVFTNAWPQSSMPGPSSSSDAPMRNYSEPTQETGTILKQEIHWNSKVPLNKTYGELNAAQKKALLATYESLAPGDEPPFPAEGIRPIFTSIKNAQRTLQARGNVDMAVTVGADGVATKIDDFSTTRSPQMTALAQRVLMETKYKPAVCSGQPCVMRYRFTQKLRN